MLAAVFGSVATGRARPDSDVDIAILLDPDTGRGELVAALAAVVDAPIDVVFLSDAGPQLRFEIARSGVLAWEGRPRAWARMRERAMLDWWDWQPTAEAMNRAAIARMRGRLGGASGA